MTIDDLIPCPHKELYIIGIQQDDREYKGQYWFTCIDCKTTGIDKLIGYKVMPEKIFDDHFVYKK